MSASARDVVHSILADDGVAASEAFAELVQTKVSTIVEGFEADRSSTLFSEEDDPDDPDDIPDLDDVDDFDDDPDDIPDLDLGEDDE